MESHHNESQSGPSLPPPHFEKFGYTSVFFWGGGEKKKYEKNGPIFRKKNLEMAKFKSKFKCHINSAWGGWMAESIFQQFYKEAYKD